MARNIGLEVQQNLLNECDSVPRMSINLGYAFDRNLIIRKLKPKLRIAIDNKDFIIDRNDPRVPPRLKGLPMNPGSKSSNSSGGSMYQ